MNSSQACSRRSQQRRTERATAHDPARGGDEIAFVDPGPALRSSGDQAERMVRDRVTEIERRLNHRFPRDAPESGRDHW